MKISNTEAEGRKRSCRLQLKKRACSNMVIDAILIVAAVYFASQVFFWSIKW